jgi:hypothetical protein
MMCLLLLSVLMGLSATAVAQSLKDLIQVTKSSEFATGFAPTDPAKYEALPEAPRTRAAIPRAADLPRIEIDSIETPSPNNPLGAKGVVFARYPFLVQDSKGVWTAPDGTKVAWFHDPDLNLLSVVQHA